MFADFLPAGMLGVATILFVAFLVIARFSVQQSDLKKRSRNYGRVVSRARRPVVMLNARTR